MGIPSLKQNCFERLSIRKERVEARDRRVGPGIPSGGAIHGKSVGHEGGLLRNGRFREEIADR